MSKQNAQFRSPATYQYAKPEDDTSVDQIYVNMSFNNSSNPVASVARTTSTFSVPLLDKTDDYYCAVLRFDIPLSEIPLFICPIIPNQGNANLTPFIIGIDYNGTKYPVNINFVSYEIPFNAPVQNQPTMVVTPYYYMYSIQQFLDIVNTYLKLAVTNSGFPMTGLNFPYFYWDPTTELVHLVFPTSFITSTNKPLIFMNTALQEWIAGFPVQYSGVQPQGNDYYLELYNALITPASYPGAEDLFSPVTQYPVTYPIGATGASGPNYYNITQEYKTLNNQLALKRIYITSTGLPAVAEYTPTGESTSASTLPILTDFVPNINNISDAKSIAYYYPTSQYRLIDMTSSSPLRVIDLQILWVDNFNNVLPLYIPPRGQANIKLIFVKRTLFKSIK